MNRRIFSVIKNSQIQNLISGGNLEKSEYSNALKKGKRNRKAGWTKEEDHLLLSLTKKNVRNKWSEITKYFTHKSPALCQLRYLKINPSIKKGRWNPEEDIKLTNLINDFGFSWTFISKFFKDRNAKQIRSRYINNLSRQNSPKDNKDSESTLSDNDVKNKYFDTSVSENLNPNMINIKINIKTNGNDNNEKFNPFDISSFFNNNNNNDIDETL
jgi:hypothetical protein